jgi:hypothetical protein
LPPLTPEEERLRVVLEKDVRSLTELGPRSLAHTWNLYSATDDLARRLEVIGHSVGRQGFSVGDEVLQNLEVILPGKTPETLVVAAHYDTSAESPGADASASGAAVLIALAQEMVKRKPTHSLRLVWLCDESGTPATRAAGGGTANEAPVNGNGAGETAANDRAASGNAAAATASGGHGSTTKLPPSTIGSEIYTRHLRERNVPVVATLTLGGLGLYSSRAGSQRYPEELLYGADKRTRFGNFIALLTNAGSNPLLERVRPVLANSSLPVEELILPDSAPLAADGAQARFWSAGLSGLLLTDTAQFRSEHYDDAQDTADKLDYERLARVARLLYLLVEDLAGPIEALPS